MVFIVRPKSIFKVPLLTKKRELRVVGRSKYFAMKLHGILPFRFFFWKIHPYEILSDSYSRKPSQRIPDFEIFDLISRIKT